MGRVHAPRYVSGVDQWLKTNIDSPLAKAGARLLPYLQRKVSPEQEKIAADVEALLNAQNWTDPVGGKDFGITASLVPATPLTLTPALLRIEFPEYMDRPKEAQPSAELLDRLSGAMKMPVEELSAGIYMQQGLQSVMAGVRKTPFVGYFYPDKLYDVQVWERAVNITLGEQTHVYTPPLQSERDSNTVRSRCCRLEYNLSDIDPAKLAQALTKIQSQPRAKTLRDQAAAQGAIASTGQAQVYGLVEDILTRSLSHDEVGTPQITLAKDGKGVLMTWCRIPNQLDKDGYFSHDFYRVHPEGVTGKMRELAKTLGVEPIMTLDNKNTLIQFLIPATPEELLKRFTPEPMHAAIDRTSGIELKRQVAGLESDARNIAGRATNVDAPGFAVGGVKPSAKEGPTPS